MYTLAREYWAGSVFVISCLIQGASGALLLGAISPRLFCPLRGINGRMICRVAHGDSDAIVFGYDFLSVTKASDQEAGTGSD